MAISNGESASDPSGAPESRARILEAALRCFAEDGYEGTSIRKIGQRAGVKYPLITYYFRTKEALWEAALESDLQRFNRRIQNVRNDRSDVSPTEQFKEFLRAQVEGIAAGGYSACIFIQQGMKERRLSEPSPRYRRMLERYIVRYLEQVKEVFSRARAAGVIRDIPVDDMLYLVQGAILYRLLMSTESAYITGRPAGPETVQAHLDALVREFVIAPEDRQSPAPPRAPDTPGS